MNIYFDTEFIEYPNTIELISIGMVKENGEAYYAISNEFDQAHANEWVREHVITKLESDIPRKSIAEIRGEILAFIGEDQPVFWAYFGAFDWVVFCWIFGSMLDLPANFPKYFLDLKQEMVRNQLDKDWKRSTCPDPEGEHNALVDAQWNATLHQAIQRAHLP